MPVETNFPIEFSNRSNPGDQSSFSLARPDLSRLFESAGMRSKTANTDSQNPLDSIICDTPAEFRMETKSAGLTSQMETHRMENTSDRSGGFIDMHRGDRWERNFDLRQTPDGRMNAMFRTESGLEAGPFSFLCDASISPARSRLLSDIDKFVGNPTLKSSMKADMIRFENRCAEYSLPASEIQKTYKAIDQILQPGSGLSSETKAKLAREIISQAATPSVVDQGGQETCAVASLENYIYRTHPSKAAEMLRQIAASGQFKAFGGTLVSIKHSNLMPFGEGVGMPTDKYRSYASQLFQITTVNAALKSYESDKTFVQTTERPGKSDSGEHIESPSGKSSFMGLNGAQIRKAYELIVGKPRHDNWSHFIVE